MASLETQSWWWGKSWNSHFSGASLTNAREHTEPSEGARPLGSNAPNAAPKRGHHLATTQDCGGRGLERFNCAALGAFKGAEL